MRGYTAGPSWHPPASSEGYGGFQLGSSMSSEVKCNPVTVVFSVKRLGKW